MKKADIEKKKDLAYSLYMAGLEQSDIADKVSVSRVTISKWCTAGGWKQARSAKTITKKQLVNRILLTMDKLVEQVNKNDDPSLLAGLGDKLAKMSAVIDKLDKKVNVVDIVDVFIDFSEWLEKLASVDKNITAELLKTINKYQDMYVAEKSEVK